MSKSTFSKLMKRPHLGATRMLGYALTMHDYETWEAASAVWQARLTPEECAALAWAALRALDEDHAREVANTVLDGAGAPLPPFTSPTDDAAWWAGIASPEEIDAYAVATFNALSPAKRRHFIDYAREVAA